MVDSAVDACIENKPINKVVNSMHIVKRDFFRINLFVPLKITGYGLLSYSFI